MPHPSQADVLMVPAASLLQARSACTPKRHSALVSKLPLYIRAAKSPGRTDARASTHYLQCARRLIVHVAVHEDPCCLMPNSIGCRQRVHLVVPTNLGQLAMPPQVRQDQRT